MNCKPTTWKHKGKLFSAEAYKFLGCSKLLAQQRTCGGNYPIYRNMSKRIIDCPGRDLLQHCDAKGLRATLG